MKLLPSRELHTKLQEQKKSEIDSGMFLAKKIDRLREELADVQKEHDIAIAGIRNEMQISTSEHFKSKERLATEIIEAETKLAELRKPLDEEWNKSHEITRQNNEKSEILDLFESNLKERERIVVNRESAVEAAEISAKDTVSEAEKIEEKAIEHYKETKASLGIAKKYEIFLKNDIEEKEREIEKKETRIAERENHYKKAVEAFNAEKKLLEIKKRRWTTSA